MFDLQMHGTRIHQGIPMAGLKMTIQGVGLHYKISKFYKQILGCHILMLRLVTKRAARG
jgi:hypothetical protein